MHGFRLFCVLCTLLFSSAFTVHAEETASPLRVATSSDASEDLSSDELQPDVPDSDSSFVEEDLEDLEEEAESYDADFQSDVITRLDDIAKGVNVLASPSDAEAPPDPEDYDEPVLVTDFTAPTPLVSASQEDFVNVLRFDVLVNGRDYILLFPPAYSDQLYVDSAGNLWNMGTNQVQGLVITNDTFDPYQDNGTLVYLAPCLGNNFSENHEHGSPNTFRRYYWTNYNYGERLTYDETYVRIEVTDVHHPFLVGDTLMYILIFLVGGGVLICWLNRFRRY